MNPKGRRETVPDVFGPIGPGLSFSLNPLFGLRRSWTVPRTYRVMSVDDLLFGKVLLLVSSGERVLGGSRGVPRILWGRRRS